MSLRKIIRRARTKCNILYLDSEKGAGGQLTKVWKIRYSCQPIRLNTSPAAWQLMYYDKFTVRYHVLGYMLFKPDVTIDDRLQLTTPNRKLYDIKKVINVDEQNRFLKLGLEEVTNS
ncbi:hypothetical protein ES703_18832 [subsurface metagenome]